MSSLNAYGVEVSSRYGNLRELVGAKELGDLIYHYNPTARRFALLCSGPAMLEAQALRQFIDNGGFIGSVYAFEQSEDFLEKAMKNLSFLTGKLTASRVDLGNDGAVPSNIIKLDVATIIQAVHHFNWEGAASTGEKLLKNVSTCLKSEGLLAIISSSPEQILAQWPTQVSEQLEAQTSKVLACYPDYDLLKEKMEAQGFMELENIILPGPYLSKVVNLANWDFFSDEIKEALASSFSYFKYLRDTCNWENYWNDFRIKADSGLLDQVRTCCEKKRLQIGVASLSIWKKIG